MSGISLAAGTQGVNNEDEVLGELGVNQKAIEASPRGQFISEKLPESQMMFSTNLVGRWAVNLAMLILL